MRNVLSLTTMIFLLLFMQCSSPSAAPGQKMISVTPREKENEVPLVCDTCTPVKLVPADRSDITCPACGHTRTEMLPTQVCLLKYTCPTCKTDLYPKEGDCCVFCSYGTVKCPSKQ